MSSGVIEAPDHLEVDSPSGGFDLRLLGITLLRRLPLTLALAGLGLGAGVWASGRIHAKYQAHTVLLRHNKNTSVNPDIYFEPSLRTLLETVKLRGNLDDLKRRLQTRIDDEQLFRSIDIQPGNRSDIVQISATADNPQMAARMANGISEIFQRSSAGVSRSVAQRVWRFRSGERQTLKTQLQLAQNRLSSFERAHQVSFFTDTTRLLLEQIKQLELDRNNARLAQESNQLQLQAIRQQLKGRPENIRVTSTVRHRSQVRYDELKDQLKGLLERYTEDHPQVIALRSQLAALDQQLHHAPTPEPEEESFGMDPVVRELKIRQAELTSGLEGGEHQVRSLAEEIKRHQQRLASLSGLEKDFNTLHAEIERISENLRDNDARLAEAENAMRSGISSFDIVEPASVPEDPLPSRRKLLVIAGLGLGLLLGLGLPLAVELLDRRLKSSLQFAGIGLECLGQLPQREQRSQNLYFQQWLRFVNRLLLRLDAGQSPRLLLVAAPRPLEGRSFVSEQLIDTLRFRGGQIVHVRPQRAEDNDQHDLTTWLQTHDALLPFALRCDSQTQLYTTRHDTAGRQLPLLREKLAELLARHSQAQYLIWELPPLEQQLPWLLMLAPAASALLLVGRFRGVGSGRLRGWIGELTELTPELPRFGLLNRVPWAYRQLLEGR